MWARAQAGLLAIVGGAVGEGNVQAPGLHLGPTVALGRKRCVDPLSRLCLEGGSGMSSWERPRSLSSLLQYGTEAEGGDEGG